MMSLLLSSHYTVLSTQHTAVASVLILYTLLVQQHQVRYILVREI